MLGTYIVRGGGKGVDQDIIAHVLSMHVEKLLNHKEDQYKVFQLLLCIRWSRAVCLPAPKETLF